jgi:quercetin dioxygenase-like cupin family protein
MVDIYLINTFYRIMNVEVKMKVVKSYQVEKKQLITPLFTGTDVTRQVLLPESKEYEMSIVCFGKGIRNKFHAHDAEQVVIVTEGRGIVATEDKESVVAVGDVVLIPAGEKHWYGATEDSEFSYIYFFKKGCKLTQLEV